MTVNKSVALMKDAIMAQDSTIDTVKYDADNNTYTAYDTDGNTVAFSLTTATTNQQSELADVNLVELRAERNLKLAETDWMANSDVTMTTQMTNYRQSLRDITNTYTSLDTVVWPTKP